jgi:hypothetical protein
MRFAKITAFIMFAFMIYAGAPITWDVRFGDSSSIAKSKEFEVETEQGNTTDLMPRFLDRGKPISIDSNALVRAYFRLYGSTNSYVASAATGTVYTSTANKGRVKVTVYDTDYASTTNEFYVGVDVDGYIYSAKGKLTVVNGPGINPTTNSNGRTTIDWETVDNLNTGDAPFATKPVTTVSFATNATYAVTVTGSQSNDLVTVQAQATTNAANITTNATDIADLQSATNNLQSQITSVQTQADANSVTGATHTAQIADLQSSRRLLTCRVLRITCSLR